MTDPRRADTRSGVAPHLLGTLEPVWKPVAGGCHLTRDAEAMVRAGGITSTEVRAHEPARSGSMQPLRVGSAR